MKKKILNLVFILGIILVFYPIIGRIITKINQTTVISNYKKQVDSMEEKEIKETKDKFQDYNNDLIKNDGISDLNATNIGDVLGYIEIPKININLPIYEGTSKDVLLQGIGHLENTSYPLGGKATNSVLVGHTGITSKTFFDDLDMLELKDRFYINILDNYLEYEVIDIKTVLPDETENIKIIDNEDLVTLVTCTPKYINSHRLLVIGKRVKEGDIKTNQQFTYITIINQYKGLAEFVALILITLILCYLKVKA